MRKHPEWRAGLLAGAAAIALATPAAANDFSGVVIFGDSLVDGGQTIDPLLALPQTQRAAGLTLPDGSRLRFTNRVTGGQFGETYANQVSQRLGFGTQNPSQPIELNAIVDLEAARATPPAINIITGNFASPAGLNYGVGGYRAAQVLASVSGPAAVTPGALSPVLRPIPVAPFAAPPPNRVGPAFLEGPNRAAINNALVIISAGGNDVRDQAFTNPAAMEAAALAVVQSAAALVNAGAGLVVVPTLPDVGNTPEAVRLERLGAATPVRAARSTNTDLFNAAVDAGLAGLGGRVLRVDFDALFDALIANPAAFGLAPIDQVSTCFDGASAVACDENPLLGRTANAAGFTQMVFNDGIHPTTTTHSLATDLVMAMLTAPGVVSVAPLLPIESGRQTFEAVEDAIERALDGGPGIQPFLGLGGGRTDYTGGVDSVFYSGTGGVTYNFGNGMAAGAAVSWQGIDAEAALGNPEFGGNVFLGAVFGGFEQGRFFGDVAGIAGVSNLDDISRRTTVGQRVSVNTGETGGPVYGGSARVGARLIQGENWSLGPIARIAHISSSLDGYSEGGDAYSAMRFGEMEADSTRGGIGMFMEGTAPLTGGLATGRVEFSYEHEFTDKTDDFTAGPATTTGGQALFRGRDVDQGGLHIGLSLNANLGVAVASVGFDARLGNEEDSQSVRAQVSIPF